MKKHACLAFSMVFAVSLSLSCRDSAQNSVTGPEKTGAYKNGLYEGKTARDYEGYDALASIEVKQGFIAAVAWSIYDNNLKRYFDASYEQVYAGNPVYIQQCRDNMKGMVTYGPELIQTQSIDSVEAITHATWCYWKFKEVVKITLKDAKADTSGAE
jgi:major membrane immunogen (membrane-anchored lipoprotein)